MKRPAISPAIVISIIALVFSVTGTALATVNVLSQKEKKQSRRIAKEVISKAAPGLSVNHASTANSATGASHASTADLATNANHAFAADTAANASQLGGKPAGEFEGRLWAVVRPDGSLARGAGVVSSTGEGGDYEVRFNRDISGCAFAATIGHPADGAELFGLIEVHIESLDYARDTVGVFTGSTSGVVKPFGFHLIVAC
jgi:hypothetical protein